MFALLYAGDTVLMSETYDGLQTLLNNVWNIVAQSNSGCLTPKENYYKSGLKGY